MSQFEKLIKRVLEGRAISIDEAQLLLKRLGFDGPFVSGSHFIFRKKGYPTTVSLKRRAELLPYQMRLLQEVLQDHGH